MDCKENVKVEDVKTRWVDLSGLPRKGKLIDWENSIGNFVDFVYENIIGKVEIIGYDSNNGRPKLKIKYNDNMMNIKIDAFSDCKIAELLKEELFRPEYDESNPRRVDLRNVPLNSKGVNWSKVAKYKMKIPFVYDDISGEVEVVDYIQQSQKIILKYKDNKPYKINTTLFFKCKLQGLLKEDLLIPKYDESNPRRIDLRNSPLNSYGIDWSLIAENKMYFNFVYDDIKGVVQVIEYNLKNQKVKIAYKDNIDVVNTNDFLKCSLGNLLNKITKDFKINIGTTIKDNKRDIIVLDREYRNVNDKYGYSYNEKWYHYKCNECGYDEGWIVESDLLRGRGCVCCANKKIIKGVNDLATTHPWMMPYLINIDDAYTHTYGSGDKVLMKCPDCGNIKKYKISSLLTYKKIPCTCGDGYSYGHKYMFNLLEQLNIEFEDNKTMDWCKFYSPFQNKEYKGEYDFIIENNKLIIEVDGGFHREDNTMSGQKKEESEFIDEEKDRLALENGYDVIRVVYEDDFEMKNPILNSKIIKYFDLNNINWNESEEFACKNIVKEVCEYWNNKNQNETTYDLSKEFKVASSTIRNYLKKGNKLGWLTTPYNPKEEMSKYKNNKNTDRTNAVIKMKEVVEKKIEVFKDEISLGIYPSGAYLSDNSEELFGIKLIKSSISEVANGKRNHHKGYTFKYLQKL